MAADQRGERNRPIYLGSGASADAEDLTELGQRIADLGTRRVGTTDERNALDPAEKFDGLLWFDTTDRNEYRYEGGGWQLYSMSRPLVKTGVLYGSGSNPNNGAGGYALVYYRVTAGWCDVQYTCYWNGAGVSAGSGNWGLRLPVPSVLSSAGRILLAGNYVRGSGTNFALFGHFDGGDSNNIPMLYSDAGVRINPANASNLAGGGDRLLLQGGYPTVASATA